MRRRCIDDMSKGPQAPQLGILVYILGFDLGNYNKLAIIPNIDMVVLIYEAAGTWAFEAVKGQSVLEHAEALGLRRWRAEALGRPPTWKGEHLGIALPQTQQEQ